MDSDLELFERWCGGDANAGNELFSRHFDAVYGFFARKVDAEAEELVQETFVACVKGRDAFRRGSSFRTYLFAIARNRLFEYWRRRGARGRVVIDVAEISLADLATTVGTRLARQEDNNQLLRALQHLPLDDQLLLEMFYWEDMDSVALGEVFDLAPASVRSRLHRARQSLRVELDRDSTAPDTASITNLDAWARRLRPGRETSMTR